MSNALLSHNHTVPIDGRIAVINTTTSSANADLSSAAQLGDAVYSGQFLTLVSSVNLSFKFTSDSAATVSASATSGATRAAYLPANTPIRFRIPNSVSGAPFKYLAHLGSGSGIVRIWVSSAEGA